MAKEKQDISLSYLSRFNSRRLGNEIELLGLPMAISPLHDKDLSSVEGQLYKSTLSCALCGENPVTADSVRWKIKNAWAKKCCYGSDSSEYRKHVFVSNT